MASIDADSQVVLAIRVWKSSVSRTHEGGPTRGPFFIGRLEQLTTRALLDEIPYLALVAIFAAVGLYHLRLYAEHRGLVEHFWFGAFSLDVAAYCLLRTQWKYALSDDFILLKNLEYVAIYLLPAVGIQLTATLFSRPIGRWLRAYQLSFVALAALAGLTPDLRFNITTLWLAQIWVLPTLALAGVVGFQEYRRGHPQAKFLSSAFFLACFLFDIAADHDWVRGPRMIPVGMTVMIFSMAASLANRLIRTHRELETLTDTLEARVTLQTSQLRERSEQLEQKNRELEAAHGSLREASLTDPLTGLSNRRFLSEYLGHDVAQVLREYARTATGSASPERSDLVFLMLDLDHFKTLNDHHGHDAGDRVLEQTANILREVCRTADFIARWGGEEFLVVSRFVDRIGAATLAERMREAVAQHAFDVGAGLRVPQTCSIGFASFPFLEQHPQEHGWQEVVNVADRMLYLAKENGRDSWAGVCHATGEPGDELPRRIREDLSGCVSRGAIQCQTSREYDEAPVGEAIANEPRTGDPEKDEPT
jgi:diguanylate cyclase (GGDEF)-like protein